MKKLWLLQFPAKPCAKTFDFFFSDFLLLLRSTPSPESASFFSISSIHGSHPLQPPFCNSSSPPFFSTATPPSSSSCVTAVRLQSLLPPPPTSPALSLFLRRKSQVLTGIASQTQNRRHSSRDPSLKLTTRFKALTRSRPEHDPARFIAQAQLNSAFSSPQIRSCHLCNLNQNQTSNQN